MNSLNRIKIVLLVLLALAVTLGFYAAADQIRFQCEKSEYISSARQYAVDLVAADNITKDDCEKGTEWILTNQKKKRGELLRKYSQGMEPDLTLDYLRELDAKLSSGWKWHDETVSEIHVVSAWKNPFSRYAHVTLAYSTEIKCDFGGTVVYEGSVASMKSENHAAGTMWTYSWNDFIVSCDGKREVTIVGSENQNKTQPCVSLQLQNN